MKTFIYVDGVEEPGEREYSVGGSAICRPQAIRPPLFIIVYDPHKFAPPAKTSPKTIIC